MNNIVLLNLSDMHCMANNDQQKEIFAAFFKELKSFVEDNPAWRPDFIVIPGDIIDGHNKTEEDKIASYQLARNFIKEVSAWSGLQMNHDVITIPGNHDRVYPSPKLKKNYFRQLNKKFKAFQEGDSSGNVMNVLELEDNLFRLYCSEFADYILDEQITDGKFICPESLKQFNCRKTIGYRAYDSLKVVFLLLNTEWLICPSQFGEARICCGRRFVKEAVKEIQAKYPDYIIVTTMHHPLSQIEWEEKNIDRMDLFNPYHMILGISDIIISGHDHLISSNNEPEYLANMAQHFQLGSFACNPDPGKDIFLNSASLLKIDSVNNFVQMSYIYLNLSNGNIKWNFSPTTTAYPLRGRFGKRKKIDFKDKHPIPDKYELNDISIVWVKRLSASKDKCISKSGQMAQEHIQYINREIIRHFYYGQTYAESLITGLEAFNTYSVDNDNVCILTLEEWNKKLPDTDTLRIHYIIYSQELNKYSELLTAKQRFLLDDGILKDTLSTVIIQNN
ncbi:metallophosphoesterase [Bacteroides fragilis]|uniref:metallophosphoesterase family protein n=1 Tax=Bacteroides fragilis TaxID=817 RepID=UPI00202F784D|nr:metallophosphoesterase [Bacteroides fragilis]MCM0237634.1 metallophosphoesterase [Bacteroides fragilis]